MIFVNPPKYYTHNAYVNLGIKKNVWELWTHYCRINARHPLATFAHIIESAMIRECPTIQDLVDQDGRPGERSHRPPAAHTTTTINTASAPNRKG